MGCRKTVDIVAEYWFNFVKTIIKNHGCTYARYTVNVVMCRLLCFERNIKWSNNQFEKPYAKHTPCLPATSLHISSSAVA